MPQTVDNERLTGKTIIRNGIEMSGILEMDPTKPPMMQIPFLDWPLIVYKHPAAAFYTIEHRNTRHEVVEEEVVPSEHTTLKVNDQTELERALEAGYVRTPYIPQARPDPKAHLYGTKKKK